MTIWIYKFMFQSKQGMNHLFLENQLITLCCLGWLIPFMAHRTNSKCKKSFLYLLSLINSFVAALRVSLGGIVCALGCNVLQSSRSGAKIMKIQNLIQGRCAHFECMCNIFLWCLHTSKRKQVSKFLGFRVSKETSRASCTHNERRKVCTNRFVYKTGPGKVCLSVPQQDPSNKTNTQMQKNLWGQLFRLMKVQGLVIYNATVWPGLELGICHKAHVHILIHSTIVSMLLLWHLKVSNLFLQNWHFLLLWILCISIWTGWSL